MAVCLCDISNVGMEGATAVAVARVRSFLSASAGRAVQVVVCFRAAMLRNQPPRGTCSAVAFRRARAC